MAVKLRLHYLGDSFLFLLLPSVSTDVVVVIVVVVVVVVVFVVEGAVVVDAEEH